MARAPAREAATIGGVRVALQPPNPLEGTRQPDEGGFFAYHPECADGVVVDTDLDQALKNFDQALKNFNQVLKNFDQALRNFDQALSTPPARLSSAPSHLESRCVGVTVRARTFAGGSDLLGVAPSDPRVAQKIANLILEQRLALAAELGVAPRSPIVSSVLAAERDEDRNLTIFSLALAVLTAARERSLAAVLALALLAAEPPAEGVDQTPAARSGAPPGAERTPRQQRVCLAARSSTAKESGNAGAGLLPPTEGRQAARAGASSAA